ncbi:hypothetical protein ACFL43_02350 [Thermodesulfobacteriota bacterium]
MIGLDNLFYQDVSSKPGIYIWTVQTNEGCLVDYIGETGKPMLERSIEHLLDQYNGRYNIFDPKKLKEGKREHIWEGYHWRKKERPEKIKLFYKDFEKYAEAIVDTFKDCQIFMAAFTAKARIRKRIESAIIKNIASKKDFSSSLQNPPQRTIVRNDDEEPIQLEITTDENILGLDKSLEA